jgi:hypothetical protein
MQQKGKRSSQVLAHSRWLSTVDDPVRVLGIVLGILVMS